MSGGLQKPGQCFHEAQSITEMSSPFWENAAVWRVLVSRALPKFPFSGTPGVHFQIDNSLSNNEESSLISTFDYGFHAMR